MSGERRVRHPQSKSAVSEGIEDRNSEASKIAFVARGDGEPMNACRARNHGIFDQCIGLPRDQAGVFAKAAASIGNTCEVLSRRAAHTSISFAFAGSDCRVSSMPLLNFAESDRRKEALFNLEALMFYLTPSQMTSQQAEGFAFRQFGARP
jgi:hypothetical protein